MAIFQLILKVEAELPVNEMQAVREGVKDDMLVEIMDMVKI